MPQAYLLIPLFGIFAGTAIILKAMNLVGRYISDRNKPALSDAAIGELIRRLDRIEQIVDTTGVEVERLAESNRFMSKLLSERGTSQAK